MTDHPTNSKLEDRLAEYKIGYQITPEIDINNHINNMIQTIYKDLMDGIPGKKIGTDKVPLNDLERGYNVAIEDVIWFIREYTGGDKE